MRIVVAHNYYQLSGGEDTVFNAESNLLEKYGHYVVRYTCSNTETASYSPLALAGSTLWNNAQYRKIRNLLRVERPELVHVHNTLPLISPAILYAAEAEGVPVIQMLHNYRPFCLNGVLYRDGNVCEDCIGRVPVRGVLHKCYRDSMGASAAILALYMVHYKALRTYEKHVSLFITSTQFAKNLFVRMGMPGDKIEVKPNLVNVAETRHKTVFRDDRKRAIYVGRLDDRKGIWTLLRAIEKIHNPIVIIGDGTLRPSIEAWLAERPKVEAEITGWLGVEELAQKFAEASMLILPSEFYESFGNVIVEAFSYGIPVITTNIGAQAELVQNGINGFIFPVGDSTALAETMRKLNENVELRDQLGRNARLDYENKYTPERNYQILMDIYQRVISQV